MSPWRSRRLFDATTSLTVPPSITSPIATGAARTALAHAAAHIGIERQPERAQQDLALAGVGIAHSSMRKSDAFGSPTGRETRTTRFADWDMGVSSDFF